jgi:hypothetical protein
MVGGVQLPGLTPGAVQEGTVIAVTLAKSPVARISFAISVARAAVIFGASVKESELGPPDPPGAQDPLRLLNLVR